MESKKALVYYNGKKGGVAAKNAAGYVFEYAANAINSIVELEPKFFSMTHRSFLSSPRQSRLLEVIAERLQRLKE